MLLDMSKHVIVRLTEEQRSRLLGLIHTGEAPARTQTRARILLKADAAGPDPWPDERIADALDVSRMTVQRVRQQFAAEGLDATLHRKRPTGRQYRSQGQAQTDEAVAGACLCSKGTVGNVRRRFIAEGLDAALKDKPLPGAKPKITGEVEAHLITLCCSDPPQGEARWTLRLLADRLVELGLLESITPAAIHGRLKKTNLSLGR